MMFYESINSKNFVFRPFLFNTILIFVSIGLILPIMGKLEYDNNNYNNNNNDNSNNNNNNNNNNTNIKHLLLDVLINDTWFLTTREQEYGC